VDDGADAKATVVGSSARWEGGLIVTQLNLRTSACRSEALCPAEVSLDVLGGTVSGLTQIVGHRATPDVGATMQLVWHDGRPLWADAARHAPLHDDDGERRAERGMLPSKGKNDPRRAHDRAPVELDVIVQGEDTVMRGHTENLSEGGVFVALNDDGAPAIERGTPVELTLELPGRAEPAIVLGEVRWVRDAAGEEGPAGLGIRFIELDDEDAAAIQRLVDDEEASAS